MFKAIPNWVLVMGPIMGPLISWQKGREEYTFFCCGNTNSIANSAKMIGQLKTWKILFPWVYITLEALFITFSMYVV